MAYHSVVCLHYNLGWKHFRSICGVFRPLEWRRLVQLLDLGWDSRYHSDRCVCRKLRHPSLDLTPIHESFITQAEIAGGRQYDTEAVPWFLLEEHPAKQQLACRKQWPSFWIWQKLCRYLRVVKLVNEGRWDYETTSIAKEPKQLSSPAIHLVQQLLLWVWAHFWEWCLESSQLLR